MQNLLNTIKGDSDGKVIDKILNGDPSLFEVLIRRYNSVIYKVARSYGFKHKDAEDLMQETHVSAYLGLKQYEGRSSYKTWITSIMIHKCLDRLKHGCLTCEVSSDVIPAPNHNPMITRLQVNQTETMLLNSELTLILERSLQNIPVMYRTVFILREMEGFSVKETAELLDITPINVKIRLSRAKALLQSEVDRYYTHSELYSFNLVYCNVIVRKVFERINQIINDSSSSRDIY